jgi:hypothetical protein
MRKTLALAAILVLLATSLSACCGTCIKDPPCAPKSESK